MAEDALLLSSSLDLPDDLSLLTLTVKDERKVGQERSRKGSTANSDDLDAHFFEEFVPDTEFPGAAAKKNELKPPTQLAKSKSTTKTSI